MRTRVFNKRLPGFLPELGALTEEDKELPPFASRLPAWATRLSISRALASGNSAKAARTSSSSSWTRNHLAVENKGRH